MSDDTRSLARELRWIASNKLNGVPHAEALLRAADALEGKDFPVMCDMPVFMDHEDRRRDSFLRVPWPMTEKEFRFIVKALTGLHDLYAPHFAPEHTEPDDD